MVVQAAVVTGGTIDRSVPEAARARYASRLGINPRCRIGSSTVQVGTVQAQDKHVDRRSLAWDRS